MSNKNKIIESSTPLDISEVTFKNASAIFAALDDLALKELLHLETEITNACRAWIEITTKKIIDSITSDDKTEEIIETVLRQELLPTMIRDHAKIGFEVLHKF